MKFNRIAATVTAAFIPFTMSGMTNLETFNVYAEEDLDVQSLPDWVPQSFDEALNFRNTYGATHVGTLDTNNDTLCIVFPESVDGKYEIKSTNEELTVLYDEAFINKDDNMKYEVVVYQNVNQTADASYFKINRYLDSDPQGSYEFSSFASGEIREEGLNSWLPDCVTEYKDYVKKNGEVSVKDNYVVFCLDSNSGTAYDWFLSSQSDNISCFKFLGATSCDEHPIKPLDGGQMHSILLYQAKKDGRSKISYDYVADYGTPYRPEDIERTLTADCMILDDAQTILLPEMVRIRVNDSVSGMLITAPVPKINPQIKVSEEGVYVDHSVGLNANPYIWNDTIHLDSDYFKLELKQNNIPYGYLLPEEYDEVTKYENGAMDVVFRLKQDKNALKPGDVKITVIDKDTGELIPDDILETHPFSFYPDVKIDGTYTGPVFVVQKNPCIYNCELASLYKDSDGFSYICDDQPEVTLNDNDSIELVFRTKLKISGDVNGDAEFDITDVVCFQKWLLSDNNSELPFWQSADFCIDNKLDIFDLCLMKKALLEATAEKQISDMPVSLSITETGGYAGVHRVWKVYKDDGKYILSYEDQKGYVNTEPIIVEISEADYSEIMSLNYDRIIEEHKKNPREQVWDGFNYKTVLTYGNGKEKETRADMNSVLVKLEKLLDKYLSATTYVKPDREILYGSPIHVVADKITMYLGPDTRYGVVTTIPKNTVLTERGVQNNNDNWAFVEYNGQYGWIQMVANNGETQYIVDYPVAAKPVIYLYPEQETDVHVELELTEAELSTTYPKYNNGWDVTAYPDGSILNKTDGTHHKYLFWDAVNCRTRYDFSKGFCVAGSDTESFLKEKLTYMGLTEEEMNEFIVYWLPLMEHNKYNLISFQSDVYTDSAKLNITPTPDSMLRVFMAYVPLEEAVDIEPQQLSTFERNGFTVVEWGGSKIQ